MGDCMIVFDDLSECRRNAVPVQDIHADWQVRFLESLPRPKAIFLRQPVLADHLLIQVGTVCGAACHV